MLYKSQKGICCQTAEINILISTTMFNFVFSKFQLFFKHFSAPGTLQERIVGGTAAVSGEFPYQGLLIVTSNLGSTGQCGCVLIDSDWVLTAAHCTIE